MLSMDKNPFSWNERGNISGQIGALSLTTKDGSGIPVENLSEDIEVSAASDMFSILCCTVESMFKEQRLHFQQDSELVMSI